MSEEELDFRIKLAICKGRNIIYYRERDQRTRAQYIHVVRDYRKNLESLVKLMPKTEKYQSIRDFFLSVISIIDPKTKSEECIEVIIQMRKLFYPDEQ